MTVYFKGFDELLIMMDVADEFEKYDPASTLTYVIEHVTESWETYHTGIDANYSNDGHYHFRRKDELPLSFADIQLLLDTLYKYSLLTSQQHNSLLHQILKIQNMNSTSTQTYTATARFFVYLEESISEKEDNLANGSAPSR
ncbi:hypothetical protein [Legionella busanensis]|nr:hypothetical protein [Legionella busanensis]